MHVMHKMRTGTCWSVAPLRFLLLRMTTLGGQPRFFGHFSMWDLFQTFRDLLYVPNVAFEIFRPFYVTEHFTNGDKISGNYHNDKFIGHCIYTFANGDVLEGQFLNGKFVGHCKKIWTNGDTLEGKYENNAFTGQCVKIAADGTKLKGYYENDEFVGQCVFTGNCNKIEGSYKHDEFVGHCILTVINTGTTIEGIFENGDFVGECLLIYYSGVKIKGRIENGAFTGQCVTIFRDGTELRGLRANGKYIGEQEYVDQNGKSKFGTVVNERFVEYENKKSKIKPKDTISIKCPACNLFSLDFSVKDQTTFNPSSENCCVCLEVPANVFLPTCKHTILCANCAHRCKL